MRRKVIILLGPGLIVGAVVCATAFIAGRMNGSDSNMAKYAVLGAGSAPLSSLWGGAAYGAKEHLSNGVMWGVIDYGQVLLNWVLISLVIMGSITLLRRRRG